MAVKHILAEYKVAKQKKEEDEKRKESQKIEEERTRRRLNAGKVENHLREIVQPVLEFSSKEIREYGYASDVEIISKRDPHISDDEQTFALCLKMTTAHDDMSEPAWLRYEGESDGVTLRISECYGNGAFPLGREARPLSAYNQNDIEHHVEAFIRIIFKA